MAGDVVPVQLRDGLGRGHTAAVEDATTELTKDALTIRITPRIKGGDLGLECWGASRKADVLAKLLKRDIVISADDYSP